MGDLNKFRMSENEITAEIVKVERLISELKREYKNLLAKSQVNVEYKWED